MSAPSLLAILFIYDLNTEFICASYIFKRNPHFNTPNLREGEEITVQILDTKISSVCRKKSLEREENFKKSDVKNEFWCYFH